MEMTWDAMHNVRCIRDGTNVHVMGSYVMGQCLIWQCVPFLCASLNFLSLSLIYLFVFFHFCYFFFWYFFFFAFYLFIYFCFYIFILELSLLFLSSIIINSCLGSTFQNSRTIWLKEASDSLRWRIGATGVVPSLFGLWFKDYEGRQLGCPGDGA